MDSKRDRGEEYEEKNVLLSQQNWLLDRLRLGKASANKFAEYSDHL